MPPGADTTSDRRSFRPGVVLSAPRVNPGQEFQGKGANRQSHEEGHRHHAERPVDYCHQPQARGVEPPNPSSEQQQVQDNPDHQPRHCRGDNRGDGDAGHIYQNQMSWPLAAYEDQQGANRCQLAVWSDK